MVKYIIQDKMENCIFCKIVNGEIPSEKVYEDDKILAFKDINPIAPIHILIIPKKHIENLMEVQLEDTEIISDIFASIPQIAKKMNVDKDGFRLISNCGKDAGQEVMHLHFHLIGGSKLGTKMV